MTSYTYTAYGLTFSSTFPLPEFRPHTNGANDVNISYGKVPESLSSPSDNGIAWQTEPGKLLLTVKDVARYLVLGNQEVVIEPFPGSNEADIRVFLLGSVLGAVLHAHHMLVLHASVIQTKNGAALFMGNCGAGKSTLLGAFLKRGYAMLTDDKAGIVIDKNGTAQVLPGFPRVRLTKDAVKKLDFPVQNAEHNEEAGKYIVPVEKFCLENLPVKAAYALTVHNKPNIVLDRLQKIEQIELLNYNTYRRRFLNGADQRMAHFQTLTALSSQIEVSRISRPDFPAKIDELVALIEEDLD